MADGPLFVTILLAAGESRRMGQPKFFLPIGEETLLRHAINAALDEPLIVVTGAYATEIREHLADVADLHFAHNPNWEDGMSASIAVGVKRAMAFCPQGFFIMLADQPTLGRAAFSELAAAFRRDLTRIVATWYPERLGVPAIFPARYASALLDGRGPNGARQLISAAGPEVNVIRFAEPPPDLDTPEEYAAYLQRINSK